MEDKKYEHARFLIERFDHYYDTVNNKGAFYIGLNTFILSGLCIGYLTVIDKINAGYAFWALLIGMFSSCIGSMVYTLKAVMPYLKDNHVNDDQRSLIFFGGIAKHEANFFLEKFTKSTDEKILEDMIRQVHTLAKGLNTKFQNLKIASIFIIAEVTIMTLLFIHITQNLQQ
jgi:hypothetical protein